MIPYLRTEGVPSAGWYTNLEQTPPNRCQQLPEPYKRLIHDRNETRKRTSNRPS